MALTLLSIKAALPQPRPYRMPDGGVTDRHKRAGDDRHNGASRSGVKRASQRV